MLASAAVAEPDYKLLNSIATCQSVRCLSGYKSAAQQETERTVLYARWLILQPSSREASKGLLENMLTTEHELMLLSTLPEWHEGATTSVAQMGHLDDIYSAWPRLLGVAVQRWHDFLPAYIRYGRLAINDIHLDYTGYERSVCKANPHGFQAAFLTLSKEDQAYIRKMVFDPDGCKPIFLGEADQ